MGQPDVRPHRHDRRSRAARSGRAFTIEQRSLGWPQAHALVIRQQGPVRRMLAETSDLDCATIAQRDLDDRSNQGHRSPNLDGKNPQMAQTRLG